MAALLCDLKPGDEVISNAALEAELSRLGKVTGHIANLDYGFMCKNGVPYIIDLNDRFGGGYPFSHAGGCDLPKAIVEWSMGHRISGIKEIVITMGI